MTDFALDDFLPYQLAVAAQRVSREFSTLYKEKYGLTIPEWRVLAHLSQVSQVSVREIVDRVDMDKPKVSRAAARLEAAGYIAKHASTTDRRLVELSLTDRGRGLMVELVPIANAYQDDVIERLGPDADRFRESLARFGASDRKKPGS